MSRPVSVTRWERRKALAEQLRAVWDARRDGVETWQSSFEAAREASAQSRELDARLIREMTWDDFQHLLGWHDKQEAA